VGKRREEGVNIYMLRFNVNWKTETFGGPANTRTAGPKF
jgi:hypothetical protein